MQLKINEMKNKFHQQRKHINYTYKLNLKTKKQNIHNHWFFKNNLINNSFQKNKKNHNYNHQFLNKIKRFDTIEQH